MTTPDPDVTGIVLAGGLSQRMGGGDKGLLMLGARTMLQRVIDRISPQVQTLAINANGPPERFSRYQLPVFPDTYNGYVGPLAGILAGMRWAETNTPSAQWIITVSTDAPFIPLDLVDRLRHCAKHSACAVSIARSDGNLHPVIGLWPVILADDLEQALNEGIRKVLRWTDRHGTLPVDFDLLEIDGVTLDPFFNANTPDQLAEAVDLLNRQA
ncbi:MAG: molybdenum cofactor guanylyltransferase MobA [Hyphomicrobiaceae bacterium]